MPTRCFNATSSSCRRAGEGMEGPSCVAATAPPFAVDARSLRPTSGKLPTENSVGKMRMRISADWGRFMSRSLISAACAVATLASLHIVEAAAQTGEKSRMDQAIQKMKVSEDPSSPEMQQAAAKQATCKKEAKARKLRGSARRAFMKDCIK